MTSEQKILKMNNLLREKNFFFVVRLKNNILNRLVQKKTRIQAYTYK